VTVTVWFAGDFEEPLLLHAVSRLPANGAANAAKAPLCNIDRRLTSFSGWSVILGTAFRGYAHPIRGQGEEICWLNWGELRRT
jgi:hypothetical protein